LAKHESMKPEAMNRGAPRACLMGHPVAHSRSPKIHGYWLARLGLPGSYVLEDRAPHEFAGFFTRLAANGYVGGNITVPHKEAAYALVQRRDGVAEAVGAVNTVWFDGGTLTGGNSDPFGFMANLDDRAPGWDATAARAVVLGAGGAARSAAYGLTQRGLDVVLVNRTHKRAEELAAHFGPHAAAHGLDALPVHLARADLLVNCTSLGMVGKPPLELDLAPLKRSAVVYDVVYVPLETALLRQARARGHAVVDGLGMLLHQAGFGFEKWFGVMPEVTPELRAMIEADIGA
jgi:shikimate dehydrogenase